MSDPLAPLRAKFVVRCAEDLAVVRGGPGAPDLARVVHRIAGAAGMFGYDTLGALAGRIDDRAQDGEPFDANDLDELAAALEAVARG